MKLLGIRILRNDFEDSTCTPWPCTCSSDDEHLDGRITSYSMAWALAWALALGTHRVDRSYPFNSQAFENRIAPRSI